MKTHILDKREIRSFRLRYRTLELKQFFENKNVFGFFMMTDAIQPKDRIQLHKGFTEQNLKLTRISKKISKFLTKNTEWHSIKNLLSGNVALITKKETTAPLTVELINLILKNSNFNLRFLFWNENLYRENIMKIFSQKQSQNHTLLLLQIIRKISLTPLLMINPFLKRQ